MTIQFRGMQVRIPDRFEGGWCSMAEQLEQGGDRLDPLVRSAFREALVVSLIWLCAMVWSVGVSWWLGYGRTAQDLRLVLGFPEWVFWGIVVPWVTCAVISWLFAVWFVRDGELGEDVADADDLGLGG
jgi:hypothetical protein